MELILNTNSEWEFIRSEINEKSFDEVGREKREIIFWMQIVLDRICRLDEGVEKDILVEGYERLKGNYFFP